MDISKKLPKLSDKADALAAEVSKVTEFIEKAKQYPEITELTSELVRMFIDKIVVGRKAKKYDYLGKSSTIVT